MAESADDLATEVLASTVAADPWKPIVQALDLEAQGEPVPDPLQEAVRMAATLLAGKSLVGAGVSIESVSEILERPFTVKIGYDPATDEIDVSLDWEDGI